MRATQIRFTIAALFATVAWGQPTTGQSSTQVYHFTYNPTTQGMQQLTNAIRTVGEITQSSPSFEAKTLTVSGTPSQIAMAAWIFATLDQPQPAHPVTQEFRPAGSPDDVVRVLYPVHPATAQGFQEILNAMRVIPEMTKVLPYNPQNAVVIRGTDAQASMTEWLFHQLDLPAGIQALQNPAAHLYMAPGVTNDEVQALYFAHTSSTQSVVEIVNALRAIPELPKVFPCTATGTVAVRGTPARVALAIWLFGRLDQAPLQSVPAPQEFPMPGGADDVTQIFYLAQGAGAANLKSLVNAVQPTMSRPVFPNTTLNALILRGPATQIAAADLQIKQMGKP